MVKPDHGAPAGFAAIKKCDPIPTCGGPVKEESFISRYATLSTIFDQVAPAYDALYGPQNNLVMSWMRQESLAFLDTTFPPKSRLLEIGCGTGVEAQHLAGIGHTILATDVSPEMAALTANKARIAGLSDRIRCLAIPGGHLGALKPDEPYDGAYASFGILNCEPALERLIADLADLLRPGAAFVCSVMAQWSLWEIAWHLGQGHPHLAVHRLRRDWRSASIQGTDGSAVDLKVKYFSVRQIVKAFSPAFIAEKVRALSLLLPPPHLDTVYRKFRPTFDILEPWELRLRDRWPFHGFGDHFMIVFRRH